MKSETAPADAVNVHRRLAWRRASAYHFKSSCGRFSICRMNVLDSLWYVATRNGARSVEIGATRLPIAASDDDRSRALQDMENLCEAAL